MNMQIEALRMAERFVTRLARLAPLGCSQCTNNNETAAKLLATITAAIAQHDKQAESAEPMACFIGAKGSAFDLPTTKRAYAYAEQPGNVAASKLGRALETSKQCTAGDSIDAGLNLLKALQAEGFGVFDIGAEYIASQAQADSAEPEPCSRCHGQTGWEREVLYGPDVIDMTWEDCPHCKGSGAEPEPSAEPVAVIGSDFALLWVGSGPIAPIVRKHHLKVGDHLFARPQKALEGWDAEFLAARLGRVAKLVGVPIPEDFTHEQISEAAPTILGQIASTLESNSEPIAWEAPWGAGVIRFVSDRRYKLFSPEIQKYYKPYRCAECNTRLIQAPEWWKPIETAPQDGSLFIGWDEVHGFPIFDMQFKDGELITGKTLWSGYCKFWMPRPAAPEPKA